MTRGRKQAGIMGLVSVCGLWACSSSKSPAGDGGRTDAAGDVATTADAGDASGISPTVVATLGGFPESLAMDGTVLYATILESSAGHDGLIQSVPKTGSGATVDAGTVTTLASGLNQPRAIAIHGGAILWADTELPFPASPDVMTIPLAGGTPAELFSNVTTYTRLVIMGDALYTVSGNLEAISSLLLTGDAGAGTTIFGGNPPDAVYAPDSDGAAIYFLSNGATNQDLYTVPIGGTGAATALAHNVASGSVATNYLVDDTTTLYWSDSGSGSVYSLAKTGGTPKMLATFNNGSGAVQIALDGTDIYALLNASLVRFPKAGGATPVVLASVSGSGNNSYLVSHPANANALVVDDAFVYWLYIGHQQILKLAK
jgi:hypothetical protein